METKEYETTTPTRTPVVVPINPSPEQVALAGLIEDADAGKWIAGTYRSVRTDHRCTLGLLSERCGGV